MNIINWTIIQFPTKKTSQGNQVPTTMTWIENKIYSIEKTPKPHTIYWERDTRIYYRTSQFMRILLSQGYVHISTDPIGNITHESIMTVENENIWALELPVDYFIRMTKEFPWKIKNNQDSILDHLSSLGIQVISNTNDATIKKSELQPKEVDTYTPEKMIWFSDIRNFSLCEMFHEINIPLWSGECGMFDTTHHQITILDLMIMSMEDMEINGYPVAWASMEIILTLWNSTIIKIINSSLLEEVIHNSLKRVSPLLYGNMSFTGARRHYFQKTIIPKIRPEGEQIDLDE